VFPKTNPAEYGIFDILLKIPELQQSLNLACPIFVGVGVGVGNICALIDVIFALLFTSALLKVLSKTHTFFLCCGSIGN
jgi:hypothetical protein